MRPVNLNFSHVYREKGMPVSPFVPELPDGWVQTERVHVTTDRAHRKRDVVHYRMPNIYSKDHAIDAADRGQEKRRPRSTRQGAADPRVGQKPTFFGLMLNSADRSPQPK